MDSTPNTASSFTDAQRDIMRSVARAIIPRTLRATCRARMIR